MDEALKAAGYKPEVHIFASGGHGFGMRTLGKTSDHWIDLLYYWMEAQGFTIIGGCPEITRSGATLKSWAMIVVTMVFQAVG